MLSLLVQRSSSSPGDAPAAKVPGLAHIPPSSGYNPLPSMTGAEFRQWLRDPHADDGRLNALVQQNGPVHGQPSVGDADWEDLTGWEEVKETEEPEPGAGPRAVELTERTREPEAAIAGAEGWQQIQPEPHLSPEDVQKFEQLKEKLGQAGGLEDLLRGLAGR